MTGWLSLGYLPAIITSREMISKAGPLARSAVPWVGRSILGNHSDNFKEDGFVIMVF